MKRNTLLSAIILLLSPVALATSNDSEGEIPAVLQADAASKHAALCALYDDMPDYAKAYCLFSAYQMQAIMGRFYAADMEEMIYHLHLTISINCFIDEQALALLGDKLPPHFRDILQEYNQGNKEALSQSNELYLKNPADKSASAAILIKHSDEVEAKLATLPAEYRQITEFTKLWFESLDAKFDINRKVSEHALTGKGYNSSNEAQAQRLEYTAELIEAEFNKIYATLPSYPQEED